MSDTFYEFELQPVDGFDQRTQHTVHLFAQQLQDLLRRLKKDTQYFTVEALEWQQAPGHNTAGMLMAHIAMIEVLWLVIITRGLTPAQERELAKELLGVPDELDDGMSGEPNMTHPDAIKGWSKERYHAALDRARAIVLQQMRHWTDESIRGTFTVDGIHRTYEWALYHTVEHFAMHHGQILLLRHMMIDRGIMTQRPPEE